MSDLLNTLNLEGQDPVSFVREPELQADFYISGVEIYDDKKRVPASWEVAGTAVKIAVDVVYINYNPDPNAFDKVREFFDSGATTPPDHDPDFPCFALAYSAFKILSNYGSSDKDKPYVGYIRQTLTQPRPMLDTESL